MVGTSLVDPSSLNPLKLRLTMPQSIKDMVSEFCQSPSNILPVAEADPDSIFQVRSELLDVAWKTYLIFSSHHISCFSSNWPLSFFDSMGKERIPDHVVVKPVPVSLVDHDNWQLTFDRSAGIPECVNGLSDLTIVV